jgi:hypothetical protein
MTDDISYAIPDGIEWRLKFQQPACANCHYWDAPNAIDGWATCYQLVHSNKKWELGTLEEVPQGDTAIVKTYQRFYCKYFEEIE